jgi:hypothetical protein
METIIVTPGWHKLIFHLYFAYSWFEMIRYCHPRIALAFCPIGRDGHRRAYDFAR